MRFSWYGIWEENEALLKVQVCNEIILHTRTLVYIRTCARTNACTHSHTYVHTHIHTHITLVSVEKYDGFLMLVSCTELLSLKYQVSSIRLQLLGFNYKLSDLNYQASIILLQLLEFNYQASIIRLHVNDTTNQH